MTKIELIKQVIEKKLESVKTLQEKRENVRSDKTDTLSRMYMQYFGDCLVNDDTIEVSDTYVYFKRFDSDYKYHKEMMSISVRPKSWRDDEADCIETSFYSTSSNNDFELNRMVLIGNVGQVILDFKDDIIAGYNSVQDEFKDKLSELNKEIWKLEREISDHKSEITTIQKNALLDKLEKDGLEFKVDEDNLWSLPNLDIRFDWNVRGIRKIKVLDKTKSGKSADIEIGTVHKAWNSDTEKYELVYKNNTYERVRMDKISSLVSYSKELVVS
jgi:hypothetical protein